MAQVSVVLFPYYTQESLFLQKWDAPDNRWVVLGSLIPWAEFEDEYSDEFSIEMKAPAKPFRMGLGALIIKEKLEISDRETRAAASCQEAKYILNNLEYNIINSCLLQKF